jgi:hypothetical protein
MMRCKVACELKQPYLNDAGEVEGFYLSFCPIYAGSPENEEFFRYTPGGTVAFNVLNKAAAEKFEVRKEYYLDFTPA